MFLTGYLEGLTDIDGRQIEFGASVKVFQSNNSENIIVGKKGTINCLHTNKY